MGNIGENMAAKRRQQNIVKREKQKVPTDISAERIKEINEQHLKVLEYLKKGAIRAFKMGESLHNIYMRLPVGTSWPQFVKDNFIFSVSAASTYTKIYENYKDNRKKLDGQTISAAIESLGKKPAEKKGKVEYGNPDKQLEFDWESCFAKPTLSKAKLNNYRFECPDDRSLWLVKRGYNVPIKFLDLFTEPETRDELKFHYEGMLKGIQASVEKYFEALEKTEAAE